MACQSSPPDTLAAELMGSRDQSICPDARLAIATIADRLRRLPCDNSVVTMDLHRIARELEAIVARTAAFAPAAEPEAAISPDASPAPGEWPVSAEKR